MLRSMTGYGSAEGEVGGRHLSIDVRAVNHRYFNFMAKVPHNLISLESRIQNVVKKSLSRGQVSLFANWDKRGGQAGAQVNMEAAKNAIAALRQMKVDFRLGGEVEVGHLLNVPGIFGSPEIMLEEEELWVAVEAILNKALVGMEEFRLREGEDLFRDVEARLVAIEAMMNEVAVASPKIVVSYRERLVRRIEEICTDVVKPETIAERVALETAMIAERSDVSEEIVRLKSHIDKCREMVRENAPVGRKLDFLVQEMNRETNTIGSKSPDAGISRIVVEIKAELEKVREQIQNIE